MKPAKESKEDRFRRLVEARVNKIIKMLRLLGNCSGTNAYAYTMDQVDQVFSVLQTELDSAKQRYMDQDKPKKNRFTLSDPEPRKQKIPNPSLVIPLPDRSYLRAVGYPQDSYPSITIYWDRADEQFADGICFVEFNPDKIGDQRLCIGAYCAEEEDTKYYGPYITAERINGDE